MAVIANQQFSTCAKTQPLNLTRMVSECIQCQHRLNFDFQPWNHDYEYSRVRRVQAQPVPTLSDYDAEAEETRLPHAWSSII
jgi:hypothetical protein